MDWDRNSKVQRLAPPDDARRCIPRRLRRVAEVPRRHQVRVDVVVDDRGVLVRPGDAVDPEVARRVVVAERAPQPRGRHEQLEPGPSSNSCRVARRSAGPRRRCRR